MKRLGLLGLVVCGAAAPAQAYDFSVDVRTIGQGYQVRGFAPDGSNELLSRRRLTQYLNLNVYDIEPDAWHGDDGGRNVLYVDASFRFDADFGGYLIGAPTGQNAIAELKQNEVDILYAYLGGRNVGGHLDFQLGRQIHFDLVDFYAFDGADLLYHATRLFGVEAFGGTEVRGEMPLVVADVRAGRDERRLARSGDAAGAELRDAPLAGAALVAGAPTGSPGRRGFRTGEIWSATADRLPGEPDSGINEEVVSLTAMAAWRNRSSSRGASATTSSTTSWTTSSWRCASSSPAPVVDARARRTGADLRRRLDLERLLDRRLPRPARQLRDRPAGRREGLRARLRPLLPPTPDEMSGAYAGQESGAGDDRFAAGGSLGAAWRDARGMVRADGYLDGGYGGRKIGVDATTRVKVRPAIELEGRLTGYGWRNDLPSATPSGVVFGAQAGGRIQLGEGTRAHLLLEDNVGTYYESQFRGLAMLELDAGI